MDRLDDAKARLAKVPALVEALKAIGEVAVVANEGDSWYCRHEGVDTEREVIIEERRMRTDNVPRALLQERMAAALWMTNRYSIPIIGWEAEMRGLTQKDALDYYNKYYTPNNAILVVSGDVTVDSFKPLAEKYFGESNALEAGRKIAGKNMDPNEVTQILRQMKPDERALFKEGYASDLANRVIDSKSDTTNLTAGRGVFKSPNDRKIAAAIFGPGGMAQLEARMHLETIMHGAYKAMGNSTTARQLIEAGLAGGAMGTYDLYESGGNLMSGLHGLGQGAAMGLAYSHGLKPVMAAAAKKITGNVNSEIVSNVARLLTSDNPAELQRGLKMLAQNKVLAARMRAMASNVALAGQAQAGRLYVSPAMKGLQGPMSGRADQEQQSPQGIVNQ